MGNLIIGYGQTGKALVSFFKKNRSDQNLIIYDSREDINIISDELITDKIKFYFGRKGFLEINKKSKSNLAKKTQVDEIYLSPGINPNDEKINQIIKICESENPNIKINSGIRPFLKLCKSTNYCDNRNKWQI